MIQNTYQNIYIRLFSLIRPYWKLLVISSIAAIIYVLLNGASVWLTASLIGNILTDFNDLLARQSGWAHSSERTLNEWLKYSMNRIVLKETAVDTLWSLCSVIFVVFIFKNAIMYIKNIIVSYVQLRMITDYRNQIYKHLLGLSLEFYNKSKTGELTSIIINDVQVMQNAFTTSFQKLLIEPLNILSMMSLLFIINWRLALACMSIIPVTGIIISKLGDSIRRKSRRTQAQIANIMHILNETIPSMRIIKSFVNESKEVQRFIIASEKYFDLMFRRVKLSHLTTPINEIIGVGIGVLLLWYGGLEVINTKTMHPDDFIRFILLMFAVLVPVKELSRVHVQIQAAVASAERVFALLDKKPTIKSPVNAIELTQFNRSIDFQNVHFTYDGEETVLSDINFSIEKGAIIALVGPSGAGKSTLIDLIPRFYDVTGGKIFIDNVNIKDASVASIRNLIGIVSQDIFLFNDTIKNNITYGVESITEEEVTKALKLANAWTFINQFPNGIETNVGEAGVALSGGQKQRIAIARAIIKNPSILILDEATSALDSTAEREVQNALDSAMKERTVIIIAHRLSTVRNATKIIVMDQGKIVETGKHDELLQNNGLYNRLSKAQFSM